MAKKLVIVESPAKARTIGRILGDDYSVKASLGHIRDLPQKDLGVDVANDFAPKYVTLPGKRKVLAEIKGAAKEAKAVYLATDPDREGEAISWHLVQGARLGQMPLKRVVFHEITEEAVAEAFRHPRDIDMRLVDAYQARRILDRLVGYKISPLLWRRVRPGLSAGRVQSVTLAMIVDREHQIEGFVPAEYWSIEAELMTQSDHLQGFRARLVGFLSGSKIELENEDETSKVVAGLEQASYTVFSVQQKRTSRQPAPPFTTSTLQQEAWRKLGFGAKRTMALAQQLYEGLPLGEEGPLGLITYMRTDSTRVSSQALSEVRDHIAQNFGAHFLPPSPRRFSQKAKGAQEAHEAIRPTSIRRYPEAVKPYLTSDQLKLYRLIWQRMVASQMAAAQIDTTTVDIAARVESPGADYLLRATSSIITFPGFLMLYEEGRDEEEEEKHLLPHLAEGQRLKLLALYPEQHFTQPPPHYTEATLIKALEANGIGRPSTYVPILSLIQERGYVQKKNGRLEPTELGVIVSGLLKEYFAPIFDYSFTARMEQALDDIARGRQEWVPTLRGFYQPFEQMVSEAALNMPRTSQPTDQACELCGQPMVIKWGRWGKFLSCSGFPQCKNAKKLQVSIGVSCPECGGELVERRSKRGRIFYGCANFPGCTFTTGKRPLPPGENEKDETATE